MAINQTLAAAKQNDDESKSRLDALLTYANGVTGQADGNIGDAVKTLCDGYGGGGDVISGDVVGNGLRELSFPVAGCKNIVAYAPSIVAQIRDAGATKAYHVAAIVLDIPNRVSSGNYTDAIAFRQYVTPGERGVTSTSLPFSNISINEDGISINTSTTSSLWENGVIYKYIAW